MILCWLYVFFVSSCLCGPIASPQYNHPRSNATHRQMKELGKPKVILCALVTSWLNRVPSAQVCDATGGQLASYRPVQDLLPQYPN